jgi:hypothetical protein
MVNTDSYDIIFCALPPLDLHNIYPAPPILKGVVEAHGYKAKCFDFSMLLYNLCNNDDSTYAAISRFYELVDSPLDERAQLILDQFYKQVIEILSTVNTSYIGVSVFTHTTHRCVLDLLTLIKDSDLIHKIVLGGRGISTPVQGSVINQLNLTKKDLKIDFVDLLTSKGFLIHSVRGDGEPGIIDFLQNKKSSSETYRMTEFKNPMPNYDDYNWDDYQWLNNERALNVSGSFGCVRNCDFCDVKNHFGKYRFKDGCEFAEEIIALQKKFKINKFVLNDSLTNGGLKHFKAFVSRLAQHNSNTNHPIKWSGLYICRDLTTMPEIDEYYRLLAASGAQGLAIGAESGSDYVLDQINKKSSVEALFFELDYFRKYNITCQILTLIGHWSERHQDFVDHCKMLVNLVPYVRSATITDLQLGMIAELYPGTPASRNINIITEGSLYNNHLWLNRVNRGNTYKVRMLRRLIISMLSTELDISVTSSENFRLEYVLSVARGHREDMNAFFSKHAHGDTSQFDPIKNYQEFIDQILTYKSDLDVVLDVTATDCNTNPEMELCINNSTLFKSLLEPGQHTIKLTVNRELLIQSGNLLRISLTNKATNDTQVDCNGNILKDKSITIQSLKIDNCELTQDPEFFYQNFYYDTPDQPPSLGMWDQRVLSLKFDWPFVKWYSNRSNQNKTNLLIKQTDKEHSGNYSNSEYYQLILKEIDLLTI